ncbi:UNVERIFIED_CONTAM: hypothetical protein K2H54_037774 [Gekko kuhli]
MGNSKSGALSKEILEDLKMNTKYTEDELCKWYESFQKQCPDGRITRAEFEKIYGNFFPNSDPKVYARHVFRSFDTNDDGTLDFREYIIALHLTSSGKTDLKLEWAFSLFDVDRNGEISKNEVLEIISDDEKQKSILGLGLEMWRKNEECAHSQYKEMRKTSCVGIADVSGLSRRKSILKNTFGLEI